MPYFQYTIQIQNEEQKEIAIALLDDYGFEGFEENEQELIAISRLEVDEQELEELMQAIGATYSKSILEDKNWNEKWEAEFQPITVLYPGSKEIFAYVRAHFHTAFEGAKHDLIITPKMSFGTGHHATTYGMMAYMSQIDFKDVSVVDFGTGTGVLAILAEKLGAKQILALDNDAWCIRNAEENVLINNCQNILLRESDHFETLEKADVILANINLNIIKSNLRLIADASSPETTILFSGILEKDENDILHALESFDIHANETINNNGWLIIAAKKRKTI